MPLGQTRPAWKVLRVLDRLLSLPGFGYEGIDAVRPSCPRGDDVGAGSQRDPKRPSNRPLRRPARRV